MNGHDFYHGERLMRARRNRLLFNIAVWVAVVGFLYGLGALAAKWVHP